MVEYLLENQIIYCISICGINVKYGEEIWKYLPTCHHYTKELTCFTTWWHWVSQNWSRKKKSMCFLDTTQQIFQKCSNLDYNQPTPKWMSMRHNPSTNICSSQFSSHIQLSGGRKNSAVELLNFSSWRHFHSLLNNTTGSWTGSFLRNLPSPKLLKLKLWLEKINNRSEKGIDMFMYLRSCVWNQTKSALQRKQNIYIYIYTTYILTRKSSITKYCMGTQTINFVGFRCLQKPNPA